MAIKSGKRLYATDANGTWFVKQATSPKQFQLLCIKEELEKNGYSVPKAGRYLYAPDVFWDEDAQLWRCMDGSVYGRHLPK